MTEVKSEITLKFNELPEAKPAPNKKVEITLTDQNGIIFTALINAKSWRKEARFRGEASPRNSAPEADAAAFSDWGWVCKWQARAAYRERL